MIAHAVKSKTKEGARPDPLRRAGAEYRSARSDDLFLQRKASCACGGGCPACELSEMIQTKLTVGAPDDEYEQEADRIADHVMSMPVEGSISAAPVNSPIQLKPLAITPVTVRSRVQRQPSIELATDEEPEEVIQTKAIGPVADMPGAPADTGDGEPAGSDDGIGQPPPGEGRSSGIQRQTARTHRKKMVAPDADPIADIEGVLSRRTGSGASLPGHTREFMENRFGVDFSGVRIHSDPESARLNRILSSLAFTTGQDLYFAPGTYRPGTSDGDRLLAHELTHVVQQTGGSNLRRATASTGFHIQRYGGDEDKFYTRDTGRIPGSVAHRMIEKILEASDTKLITEAPIPGAIASDHRLNLVGFADLYKSSGSIVSGVRGKYSHTHDSSREPEKDNILHFENMPRPSSKIGKFSKFASVSSSGSLDHGPNLEERDKKTGLRAWLKPPDFPAEFSVGEIKPLHEYRLSLGKLQVSNYITGFQNFVAAAHKGSGGVTRASTTGSVLNLTLPDDIDYAKFDAEHAKEPTKGDRKYPLAKPTHRIWVYKLPSGLLVYFGIPHPYAPADYPKEIESILLKLDPLLKELRQKQPTIPGKLASGKWISGVKQPIKTTGKKKRLQAKSSKTIIQRNTDKDYWNKRGKAWEKQHGEWDKGDKGAAAFLDKKARGPVRRQEVDSILNITAGPGRAVADEHDKIKRIKLWSGKTGLALGKLRFYFGNLFDRLSRFFEKIKLKFEKWFKGADKIKPKGKISKGWVGTATKVILEVGSLILKEALQQGYAAFSACINGMVDKVVDRFKDDLNEKLHEELSPVAEKVANLNEDLRKKFEEYEGPINMLVENVDQIQQWTSILSGLETAIRLGVQVVSCGTPPGVGCLWGLVPQVAMSEALELLSDTDYFKDHIAKPTANSLMKSFVGNKFQNMVAGAVETIGLSKYAEGVTQCARVPDTTGGMAGFFGAPGAFDPNAPNVVKARQAWEAKYHDKMMADILAAFEHTPDEKGQKPKPMTKEDVEKLIEQLKKAKLDPESLRALVKGAKKRKGSKVIKFEDFLKELEKAPGDTTRTAAPESPSATQAPTGADPVTPPAADKGKDVEAAAGDAQGTTGTDAKTDSTGVPLFDAKKLKKFDDTTPFVPIPTDFYRIVAKPEHEQGKIYDVTLNMFEEIPIFEEKEGIIIEHMYSVSNIRAVVLDKKWIESRKEYKVTYNVLENILVKFSRTGSTKVEEHMIPKGKAPGYLKMKK